MIRLADAFGVTLKLTVYCLRYDTNDCDCEDPVRLHALNLEYPNHSQLIAWYEKYGFTLDATNIPDDQPDASMTRQPQAR